MTRRESPADDLLHGVHHLARLSREESEVTDDHLSVGDLAALTAGTLFESECTRIENHLLVCRSCRDLAASLHREYEAGAVPILLRRRAPRGPAKPSIRESLARRWSPFIIALVAAGAVLMVTAGRDVLFGGGDEERPRRRLILDRHGSPDVRRSDQSLRPAMPGEWLYPDERLAFEAGDSVTYLDEFGAVGELSLDGEEVLARSPLLVEVFSAGYERWTTRHEEIREVIDVEVSEDDGLVIEHPLGLLLDRRPTFSWSGGSPEMRYLVRVHEEDGGRIFEVEAAGMSCTFPSARVSLPAGRKYVVTVEPKGLARERVEAEFEVVAGTLRERVGGSGGELETLGRLVGRQANVLRAELLWHRGFLSEARRELERLRRADGDNLYVLVRLEWLLLDQGLASGARRVQELLEKRGVPR